jgi:hypothetical protein
MIIFRKELMEFYLEINIIYYKIINGNQKGRKKVANIENLTGCAQKIKQESWFH